MAKMQKKIQLANLGDITIGRGILEPGWSWEKCVKPIAKTDIVRLHILSTLFLVE
jgi:hypothetical protein